MVQLCAYHILLDNGSSPSAKVVHPFIVEKCHHWCSFHTATITINNQLISIRVLHPFVIKWCDFQSLAITINCANKSKKFTPICVRVRIPTKYVSQDLASILDEKPRLPCKILIGRNLSRCTPNSSKVPGKI